MIKDFHGNPVEPYWIHSQYGEFGPSHTYGIRVDAQWAGLTEHLGKIIERHDGRLDWFRSDTRYYKGQWSGLAQGVADTFSEAMVEIEKGWVAPQEGKNKGG